MIHTRCWHRRRSTRENRLPALIVSAHLTGDWARRYIAEESRKNGKVTAENAQRNCRFTAY